MHFTVVKKKGREIVVKAEKDDADIPIFHKKKHKEHPYCVTFTRFYTYCTFL